MNKGFVEDKIRLRLLKHIGASNRHLTQRDLAGSLGISLGKTHYCLAELIKKGYVKATLFKNSRNKAAYAYMLTPQGIEEKLHLLMRFLRHKEIEYRVLEQEITQLHQELSPYNITESTEHL